MNQQQTTGNFSFSSYGLISFIVKWWKHIVIISFIGFVASIGMSLTIKNKYKSTVVFYPTTTNSISKVLLDATGTAKQDFLEFGEEEQAEQCLQILQSDEIREWVIREYDLYNHYKIKPDSKYAKTKMYKRFAGNVNFRRTEYNSVEISVLDEDPNVASGMANDIAAQLDSVKNRIQKERAREGFKIVEAEFNRLNAEIAQITDSLNRIRALGVNDYISMAEVLNDAYAQAIAKGNTSGANSIKQQLDLVSKYGGAYMLLSENLELYLKQRADLKVKYDEAKVDAEQFVPQKMVVNYAYPADKKTYPKRSMIVLGGTFATFCMTVFFLIGLENWRRYKNESRIRKEKETATV
jgi:uncharacterized protein involved in exopolysaccharide biosynthesis